jgi:cell division septum initiation protein DivIVA
MPDQSTAATEHSLIQEITAPLSTIPDDPLTTVADVDFPTVLRGYDRLAVDAYVRQTSQLVAELQATRSPEAAVRRALGRVGEEVSSILQRAHETAEQITSQSRSEAEERLETARREASEITSGARERVTNLDSETDRIWAERHRIVEDARELARSLLALAESAAERFPAAPEDAPASEPESGEAESPEAGPLDKWDDEELDNWDDDDELHDPEAGDREPAANQLSSEEGDAVEQDSEATTAMPPVAPAEPPALPTEETRKLK